MEQVLVSVIVPTKNSSATLEKCLESIKNQTYKNVEIIVVDNNSSDNTIEIGKKYTNKIYTKGPERSAQVNEGVRMASGKYIYRVDADFVLDPCIIEEAVMMAESNHYAAILIHNTSDPSVSFWARVRKFERDMYASDDTNVAVRFILRDVFLSVGGFDPELVAGEDYDLHNRIVTKYPIGRIEPKEVHLGEPRSIKEIAEKNYYYGKTLSLFLERNREKGMKQIGPFRRAYLKHYKEFLRHPDLAAGFVIYQFVRYSASVMGLLAYRLHASTQPTK
ncbi:MAG: glycosyltransferase [Nitrososphaera sp.]|jgi:glycosyltransferase involved in cell wall biosynthesis